MTGDVSIIYQGGSGGFALYYYLLLTGQFQHSIEETWDLIDQQFPAKLINCPKEWKKYEKWPDNHDLKICSGRRLFLVCNPLWGDYNRDIPNDTYKIFLYTNLRLQMRMAWDKKAWWFSDLFKELHQVTDSDQIHIRKIINGRYHRYTGFGNKTAVFKNYKVDPFVPDIIQHYNPEYIIKLEDFVARKKLTAESNQHQLKFLDKWIQLQPKKALRLLQNYQDNSAT